MNTRDFPASTVALVLAIAASGNALAMPPLQTFDNRADFQLETGDVLEVENWTTYSAGTLLEGQTIGGITYESSSEGNLLVGSPYDAGWLLGYSLGDNRYAGFSSEMLSFTFAYPVSGFGVAFSQGNLSQGTPGSGTSTWSMNIDNGSYIFHSTATFTESDFTGEAYFAVLGLENARRIDITRIDSDSNTVWNIREIAFISTSPVPEPTSALLLMIGCCALFFRRSPVAHRQVLKT